MAIKIKNFQDFQKNTVLIILIFIPNYIFLRLKTNIENIYRQAYTITIVLLKYIILPISQYQTLLNNEKFREITLFLGFIFYLFSLILFKFSDIEIEEGLQKYYKYTKKTLVSYIYFLLYLFLSFSTYKVPIIFRS